MAAVIGAPVRHSLSPTLHNAAFKACNLDWVYLALEVEPGKGASAVEAMRSLGIQGLSVTMPHKAGAAAAADRLTPTAAKLGVVNCLFWDGDEIVGDSTDGDGFIAALNRQVPGVLERASVAVLGAGGAARSIVEALGRSNVDEIHIINRSSAKAQSASELAPQATCSRLEAVESTDIVVNATSVGMLGGPAPGESLCSAVALGQHQLVVDIVYNPLVTPLLAAAKSCGAQTLGGLPMLVHQAAVAFEHWTGEAAPIEAMESAI